MKQRKKQKYNFWRWLILTIARIKRLYFLAWGIVILFIVAFFRADVTAFLGKISQ